MPDLTKIATCCYCGSRTVLKLAGKTQHELACSACGAPLHTMKPLKVRTEAKPVRRSPTRKPSLPRQRPEKRRRKRGWISELIEDIWDEIEDIID